MQETRRCILEVLKKEEQSTVDEIVEKLQNDFDIDITAVTVRHHLSILQEEGYVTDPVLRHRNSPGRPQHIYTLTEKALDIFPNNYRHLMQHLMQELDRQLPPDGVNVIIDGVADSMARQLDLPDTLLVSQRMDLIVDYLNGQGYEAKWEQTDEGIVLHTQNCPYHHVAQNTEHLCSLDMRLVSVLVGKVPRKLSSLASGEDSCAYLIPLRVEDVTLGES